MSNIEITEKTVFLVAPGRTVLTAERGMAHAGGKITIADLRTEDPVATMREYLKSERVVVDEEALKAAQAEADELARKIKEQVAGGAKRAEAAKDATPATRAEIVEAIGKLDKNNPEHWMKDGKTPQVAAIEHELGKDITAADRDAAWSAMQGSGD
jgi:hypothetical protein